MDGIRIEFLLLEFGRIRQMRQKKLLDTPGPEYDYKYREVTLVTRHNLYQINNELPNKNKSTDGRALGGDSFDIFVIFRLI